MATGPGTQGGGGAGNAEVSALSSELMKARSSDSATTLVRHHAGAPPDKGHSVRSRAGRAAGGGRGCLQLPFHFNDFSAAEVQSPALLRTTRLHSGRPPGPLPRAHRASSATCPARGHTHTQSSTGETEGHTHTSPRRASTPHLCTHACGRPETKSPRTAAAASGEAASREPRSAVLAH